MSEGAVHSASTAGGARQLSTEIHRVIVGTAGHIDHGKSSLVKALTSIDPDRLAEEKARGMTIDLGFAPYTTAAGQTVGIIDVPGHERFIKNMVAGASSVDIFLLVVAADDGVMPQTREHVEILDLLGARQGLVAVTKIDLVDPELRELAIADIEDYLEGTPFERAPLLPVSATTGDGLDLLRAELDALIEKTSARRPEGLFRMPIQRVFSAPGHGTILTGVPVSGSIAIGETLEVLPQGFKGKVRAIQAYREDREEAAAGHSTALNLSDVPYQEVSRGDVVATPGAFRPAWLLEGSLRYLASAPRPLKHGSQVRLHVGTSEALARVVLLEGHLLEPGGEALVQFRLREPMIASRGDRYLIRLPTPMITLGGGVIAAESERRASRGRKLALASVAAKLKALEDLDAYLDQVIAERGSQETAAADAALILKCPRAEADQVVERLVEAGRLVHLDRDRLLHATAMGEIEQRLLSELDRYHSEHPLKAYADALELRSRLGLPERVVQACQRRLAEGERIELRSGAKLRRAGFEARLSGEQQTSLERLEKRLAEAGLKPPSAAELAAAEGQPVQTIQALLELLEDRDQLVSASGLHFDASAVARARQSLRDVAARHAGELIVPEVRDALGTTRKFLIPLLELFDSQGVTTRRGDKRFLVERAREETA